jgi:AcrR family transcriptional regulator
MESAPRAARPYRMGARADATAETRRRILDATVRSLGERLYDEVSLADVAGEAGVTVQTVLRHFGSKEGLTEAAAAREVEQVRAARWSPPPGDVDAALRALATHYEAWGDRVLRLLAQEERVPAIRRLTDAGRVLHHEWVDHVFGPRLAQARGAARARLRARLIAGTDVYVWKILRRDLGMDPKAAELAMRELVAALVG